MLRGVQAKGNIEEGEGALLILLGEHAFRPCGLKMAVVGNLANIIL